MRSILAVSVLAMLSSVADAQAPEGNAESRESLGVVTFERGSGRVDREARRRIQSIARRQARNHSAILIVEGYASKVGPPRKNLELSQERTDSVRRVLVNAGADPNRIVLVAHGEERASNSSKLDRRVEIRSTVSFPDLAMEQRDPEIGEDARAAGRTTIPERRSPAEPRGRDATAVARDGTTVVIVPGGAPSQAGATDTAGSPTAAAGGAARTSGGAGTSALTGIGVDPTAEDTTTSGGVGPTIIGGTAGDRSAGGGTTGAAGGTGGGTGGTGGGMGAGGTAGGGGTTGGGTSSAAGGTTGGGTAGPAGPRTPGGTAGASGGTTGAGTGGGGR